MVFLVLFLLSLWMNVLHLAAATWTLSSTSVDHFVFQTPLLILMMKESSFFPCIFVCALPLSSSLLLRLVIVKSASQINGLGCQKSLCNSPSSVPLFCAFKKIALCHCCTIIMSEGKNKKRRTCLAGESRLRVVTWQKKTTTTNFVCLHSFFVVPWATFCDVVCVWKLEPKKGIHFLSSPLFAYSCRVLFRQIKGKKEGKNPRVLL